MAIVIQFPTRENPGRGSTVSKPPQAFAYLTRAVKTQKKISAGLKFKAISIAIIKGIWASIWLTIICLWPVVRWIAGIDLLVQIVRTAYYWNTPTVYAGWTFILHFTVFTALTYFVAVYRPAGFRDSSHLVLSAKKA